MELASPDIMLRSALKRSASVADKIKPDWRAVAELLCFVAGGEVVSWGRSPVIYLGRLPGIGRVSEEMSERLVRIRLHVSGKPQPVSYTHLTLPTILLV